MMMFLTFVGMSLVFAGISAFAAFQREDRSGAAVGFGTLAFIALVIASCVAERLMRGGGA